jgi:hypothetical protein
MGVTEGKLNVSCQETACLINSTHDAHTSLAVPKEFAGVTCHQVAEANTRDLQNIRSTS